MRARCPTTTQLLLASALLLGVAMGCTRAPSLSSVRGVLVEVDAPSLREVDTFRLRDNAGQVWEFHATADFNAGASHPMTPGHMRQHMALADPITVTYRADGGALVAVSAAD